MDFAEAVESNIDTIKKAMDSEPLVAIDVDAELERSLAVAESEVNTAVLEPLDFGRGGEFRKIQEEVLVNHSPLEIKRLRGLRKRYFNAGKLYAGTLGVGLAGMAMHDMFDIAFFASSGMIVNISLVGLIISTISLHKSGAYQLSQVEQDVDLTGEWTIRYIADGKWCLRTSEKDKTIEVGEALSEVAAKGWKMDGSLGERKMVLFNAIGKLAAIRHTMQIRVEDCVELAVAFPERAEFFEDNGRKAELLVEKIDAHARWMTRKLAGWEIAVSRQSDLFSDAELEAITDVIIAQTEVFFQHEKH